MIPKKFFKMTIQEQEVFLMGRLTDLYAKEKVLRKALAKVRSNIKIDISEIDRPDLIDLKSED